MSGRRAGVKKDNDNESGSGLFSSFLLAGGAAAVGFLAHKMWSDYKDFESCHSSTSSSPSQGPRPTPTFDSEKKASTTWGVDEEAESRAVMCVVCMENKRAVILEPCGHVCLCIECGEKVRKCPICMAGIAKKKKAYIP